MKHIETLGTSSDLYAGQAVDRVGVKLGLDSRLALKSPVLPRNVMRR